jgi:CRISPR-associated endonuclease/helicase Cas3
MRRIDEEHAEPTKWCIMADIDFPTAFESLTGHPPFPWQRALYERFRAGDIPEACNLPTGLGKTSVVAVWLLALAAGPWAPRRLVYVVNRRTVVDQTTTEVEGYRKRLAQTGFFDAPLAISTLRGQFADNREWSADPTRPAVIVGTVDMIGSRLLFGGYGCGFKSRPLHAGFLGQDALVVHDEAHLEPAFQSLLEDIQREQRSGRFRDRWPLRVMALTATSRKDDEAGRPPFTLTADDKADPTIHKRIGAVKRLALHSAEDDRKALETELLRLALEHRESGRAVLVFARTVETVLNVAGALRKHRLEVETLTGVMRGLERDGLIKKPVFQRFLPPSNGAATTAPISGTVYLVCTSAGEVGVNISADHLVSDLSTFESMAQRFGRVNRFGTRDDTRVDVVYPNEFSDTDKVAPARRATLDLMRKLNGDASSAALGNLPSDERLAAFSPPPIIVPTSDILFDAWALTTIRGPLPGRPPVADWLHGVSDWEPPETQVAWREEVEEILFVKAGVKDNDPAAQQAAAQQAAALLEDYPLKPHELLRDRSDRVFDRLKKLRADPGTTKVWVVAQDETVSVTTLGELVEKGKEGIEHTTVLLPPTAGGLRDGLLYADSEFANDVADEWFTEEPADGAKRLVKRRVRVWADDPDFDDKTRGMRLIRRFDLPAEGEDAEGRSWLWFERPKSGDGEGSKANGRPVLWQVHTDDVTRNAKGFVQRLPLPDDLKNALVLAAEWHDLGKRRPHFQRILGNWDDSVLLAKSGGAKPALTIREDYRHEFGSLVDALDEQGAYFAALRQLPDDMQDVVLHLIAAHHGFGRPHFTTESATHPANGKGAAEVAAEVPRRFARLQRKFGRWGLAYLESLLRAADYAASASPSAFYTEVEP